MCVSKTFQAPVGNPLADQRSADKPGTKLLGAHAKVPTDAAVIWNYGFKQQPIIPAAMHQAGDVIRIIGSATNRMLARPV